MDFFRLSVHIHEDAMRAAQGVTEGALTKRMGPGFSARGGIVAALMAEKGITGARDCLEGEVGLYNLYHKGEYDPAPLTADLGKSFAGTSVGMKPYPCCKGTHSYVDAALALVKKHNIKAEDVREITVYCQDETNFLVHPLEKRSRPENPVDSQFSIPWAVSAVIARGRAGVGDFTEEAIKSADILEISSRVNVIEDTALYDGGLMAAAKIGVTTKQGQTYIEQSTSPAEGSGKSVPFDVYERKFRDCAAYSIKPLSDKQADKVIAGIKRLEQLDDVREIIELLS